MLNHRRAILRFFCTYLCVLLPVIGISLFVTQNMMSRLVEKENISMNQRLDRLVTEFDRKCNDYWQTALVLSEMTVMMPSAVMNDSGAAANALEVLANANLFDGSTADIFVYYGTGKLYSGKGLTRISAYFLSLLDCNPDSAARAENTLKQENLSVTVLNKSGSGGYLMYRFPIRSSRYGFHLSVHYVVDLSQLTQMVRSYLAEQELLLKLDFGADAVYLHNTAAKCVFISGEEYEAQSAADGAAHLNRALSFFDATAELSYNPSVIYQDLQHFQLINFLLLCLGLLFSAAVSFWLSRYRWERISQFLSVIQGQKKSKQRAFSRQDEFDYIQTLFEKSMLENQQIEQNAKEYRQTMLEQASTLIFHGLLRDQETVQHVLKACGVELYEEYYYLVGVLFSADDSAVETLQKALIGDLHCMMPFGKEKALLFLAELPSADPTRHQRTDMEIQIRELLRSMGAESDRIAISQVYEHLFMANYAYLEVVSLLEKIQLDHQQSQIEYWDNQLQVNASGVLQLKADDMEVFADALEKQDVDAAEEKLHHMLHYIAVTSASEENKRYLRACILQALTLAVYASGDKTGSELLLSISQADTADAERFGEQTARILHTFCTRNSRTTHFGRVIAYIEKNYTRYDLSLEEIAQFVGTSKSQMSKLFKEEAGICYIDYVTRLRMEKTRELLLQTDLSVKEIFQRVGYVDKANFSRKFKAYFGVNASEFRQHVPENRIRKNVHP